MNAERKSAAAPGQGQRRRVHSEGAERDEDSTTPHADEPLRVTIGRALHDLAAARRRHRAIDVDLADSLNEALAWLEVAHVLGADE